MRALREDQRVWLAPGIAGQEVTEGGAAAEEARAVAREVKPRGACALVRGQPRRLRAAVRAGRVEIDAPRVNLARPQRGGLRRAGPECAFRHRDDSPSRQSRKRRAVSSM